MPITDRDRRTLVIGGSVVGFFIVAFLIYKLFLSGGSTPAAEPTTAPVITSPSQTVSASPSPSATGGGGVTTFGGRDVYCMPQSYVSRLLLLNLPVPADAYFCPGVIVPTVAPSATGTSTSTSTITPTSSSSVPSAPVASSTTVGGRTVVLLGVATSASGVRAHVEVDGTFYNVVVGTRFAGGTFRLQGAVGSCASFLYGDQAFSLCRA
jgi:hypothetical protein